MSWSKHCANTCITAKFQHFSTTVKSPLAHLPVQIHRLGSGHFSTCAQVVRSCLYSGSAAEHSLPFSGAGPIRGVLSQHVCFSTPNHAPVPRISEPLLHKNSPNLVCLSGKVNQHTSKTNLDFMSCLYIPMSMRY